MPKTNIVIKPVYGSKRALLTQASKALKNHKRLVVEMTTRVLGAKDYDSALKVIGEYVVLQGVFE